MLSLTSGPLTLRISENGNRVSWISDGTPMKESPDADFWRCYADDGYEREMTVRSSRQTGRALLEGNRLTVVYDKLTSDGGRTWDVRLTIDIEALVSVRPGFLFRGRIENRSGESVRINELQLPLVDLSHGCGENTADDVLYQMNGLGWKTPDPWNRIRRVCHTEYIASDNHVVWNAMRYPGDAAMSWFGLQSGNRFLYLGHHSPELRICALAAGASPRKADPRLILAISHFPFAKSGESVTVSECFLALCDGDWKAGSDIYGAYARATWYRPPEVPDWVRHITGWQRIILRHQFGEIQFRYEDLPDVYRNGAKYGLNMLMVFGWWKGRFDNGYPIYEPDDALGGAEKLKEAIREIRDMGGRVALYTNGQLIDVNTDYYRTVGKHVCRIDIDGNDYRDHYRFGNDGLTLRAFGYKSFVTACPANEEWQNRLLEHEKMKFGYGCDSAFFDQLGGAAPLPCFNESHLHGPRPDACEEWRVEAFRRMFDACPEGKAIGTEMVNDMILPYVHYIHGIQTGAVYVPGNFPQMVQRTFPEVVQTDRFVHDDKDGTDAALGHAFVRGYRFDVSPWRGRTQLSELPDLAEKIGRILALKQAYAPYFYEG
ncbi:MAG: hypothetical protein ILO68_04235, partial [Clostridia bacterium]|nr:hypothetical protein [Clostridia bacterium]